MTKSNPWTQQEEQIIILHFETFKTRKWKQISKILSEKGYERDEVQCRQRYVNHLNPSLAMNNEISTEQLKILYEKYQNFGPKWCLIQNFIPNRTQIKIKNVFYGNIRLFLKKLYKYFTQKTAVFMNQLKTDDLQTVYDGTEEFNGLTLIKKGFKKYHYKISQQNCYQMIAQTQNSFCYLLNKILKYKTKIRPLSRKLSHQEEHIFEKQNEIKSQVRTENRELIKQTEISHLISKNNKEDRMEFNSKKTFFLQIPSMTQKRKRALQLKIVLFRFF